MKYRHNNGARLALTSGHVEEVGPEWKELDERFHGAALEAGCEVDQGIIPAAKPTKPKASPDAVTNTDDTSVIREALKRMLERDETGDFTADNLPNLKVLAREAAIPVDKELAYRVFRALQAEADAGNGESGE